jgi:hypothetical protein
MRQRIGLEIVIAACLNAIPVARAVAQEIIVGAPARVHQYDKYGHTRAQTGLVVTLSPDSIVLGPKMRAFALKEVIRVEVKSGKRRRPIAGLFKGAGAGLMVGAIGGSVGCLLVEGCRSGRHSYGFGGSTFMGGTMGLLVGAPVGLVIGSRKAYVGWAPARRQ